jgi:hypothetical protein
MSIGTADKVRTDDSVHDDAKLILEQARDAIGEIECQAGEIADAMIELCGLENFPDDAESLADDIGAEAWELAHALGDQLNRLRKEIAAWTDNDDTEAA